jgi:biotin carboxylase
MLTILCVATYFKGDAFLKEAKQQGCTVLLLTSDKLANDAWPREAIDEIHSIPRDAGEARITRTVDAVAKRHRIDRITALDDFDVEMGAMLREHLQVPGMGRTTASRFRDKLAMRMKAKHLGIPVPEFAPVFNDQDVNDWAARVPPPWMLKPRSSAAAIGIKKINNHDELWRALHAAGDQRSHCVLEQFVQGDVYHVDSIVWDGGVVFAVAFKYGRPPMQVAHEGGIFITRRLADDSAEGSALLALNRRLQDGLGLRRGVSHTEFIRRDAGDVRLEPDRAFVFLETSARVGGAFIVDTIEAGTGINLWREWAKIERAAAPRRSLRHRAVAGEAGNARHVGVRRSRNHHEDPQTSSRRLDRRVAGSAAGRSADGRLHRALLPRLLRDGAAARPAS